MQKQFGWQLPSQEALSEGPDSLLRAVATAGQNIIIPSTSARIKLIPFS